MIMKKIFYSIVALLIVVVSCTKEIENQNTEQTPNGSETLETENVEFLYATTENDAATKSILNNDLSYAWGVNDKIGVVVRNKKNKNTILYRISELYSGGGFSVDVGSSYTRYGFAVSPSMFIPVNAGKSVKDYCAPVIEEEEEVGTFLKVKYPTKYDISSYIVNENIDDGKYDMARSFFPMPMVAVNDPNSPDLMFYSIGAMVKVTMSEIPVGTKALAITFNQVVTGTFEVNNPSSPTPSVSVSDKSNPSTVTVTISADGLTEEQATHPIVLYIPVPTTEGLTILSRPNSTKAEVLRNKGYSFNTKCVYRASTTTDFRVGDKDYKIASGNLLATNNAGTLEWSFEEPLQHMRDGEGNPHVSEPTEYDPDYTPLPGPSLANNEDKQDVFTWNFLYKQFTGKDAPDLADPTFDAYPLEFGTSTKNIGGFDWHVPTAAEMTSLLYNGNAIDSDYETTYSSTPRSGYTIVSGIESVYSAKALIPVAEIDDYSVGATYTTGGSFIPVILLFPDGYIDQTADLNVIKGDNINNLRVNGSTIHYSRLKEMMSKGVVVLPMVGMYNLHAIANPNYGQEGHEEEAEYYARWYHTYSAYYCSSTSDLTPAQKAAMALDPEDPNYKYFQKNDLAYRLICNVVSSSNAFFPKSRSILYHSVRLVRSETISE